VGCPCVRVSGAGTGPVRRVRDAGVGIVVPGDWWTVPLEDDDARARAVTALVASRFGHADANPGLKRQVRNEVLAGAQRAAAAGGWVMAMMLTRAGPVSLPATMTAYRVAGSFDTDGGVRAVQEPLTASLPPGGCVDAGEGVFGLVLRAVRERPGPTAWGEADRPVLVCEYWSDPADGQGLVNLTFSTPLVDLRDGFVDLFDAIAGSLYRLDDAADPTDRDSETSPWAALEEA
jgi:hypothetical protein